MKLFIIIKLLNLCMLFTIFKANDVMYIPYFIFIGHLHQLSIKISAARLLVMSFPGHSVAFVYIAVLKWLVYCFWSHICFLQYFNNRLNTSEWSNGTVTTRKEYYFNNWMTLLSQLPLLLFTLLNSFLYQWWELSTQTTRTSRGA